MKESSRSHSRIGYILPQNFYQIAVEALNIFNDTSQKLQSIKEEGYSEIDGLTIYDKHDEVIELESLLLKECVKSVIFLCSFLESYFYDFSCIVHGDRYTGKYIEKMDLLAKIVIIPKIATGKEVPRDLDYWSGIKDLVKWRNKLIHNKTKDAISYLRNVDDYDPKFLYEEFDLQKFFVSVQTLFKELDKIDPEGLHSQKVIWWEEKG